MMKKIIAAVFLFIPLTITAQVNTVRMDWVDSVMNTMSINEKIGQLFFVELRSGDPSSVDEIEDWVKSHQIGGIFFNGKDAVEQLKLTRQLQRRAAVPLLIGMNMLPGLGSLDSVMQYPEPIMLGAIQHDSLLALLGYELARAAKTMGVNTALMPLGETMMSDKLNTASFSDRPEVVSKKSAVILNAMQQEGVLIFAKNFPVRGLTVTDLQKGMPAIQVTLDSAESKPYQQLFDDGLNGLIASATDFPVFYSNASLTKKSTFSPNSLSALFTGQWVKQKMNYNGLIATDIRSIEKQTKKYREGDAEALAFQAGNDLLMFSEDPGAAIKKIKKLIRNNNLYEQQLNNSVKKILEAKYDAGQQAQPYLTTDNLLAKLNPPTAKVLNQQLEQSAITVIKNAGQPLPLSSIDNKQFVCLLPDSSILANSFYNALTNYVAVKKIIVHHQTDPVDVLNELADDAVVVMAVFASTAAQSRHEFQQIIQPLQGSHQVIIADFGNNDLWKKADNLNTIITAYKASPGTVQAMAEIIFGALPAQGRLPIAFSQSMPSGTGLTTPAIGRLRYAIPESAGMDSRMLSKIDEIVTEAIAGKSTPGCQVLVARQGKIIYEKAFGTFSYEDSQPVDTETIYDLASLTKVSATLQAVMFMHERGLIDIYKKASVYLPELRNTNKKDITIVDILTHQAGLVPFIPLWNQTVKDSLFLPNYYNRQQHPEYPLQVAPNLYAAPTLRDSVWMWIIKSKMLDKVPRTNYPYRYSDLGFMILQHLAERILNQPLDQFLQQNYYEPLGCSTTGFVPLDRFNRNQITPTEYDKIFRKGLVQGTVHDERAAMLGGVSGHAGLFSSAHDLAKLAQMLLQGGYYGGQRYYQSETVNAFAARTFSSRRGLGWDKPVSSDWTGSPTSISASPLTYGHTGFTGTCMWIDPEFDLVYIFLSNRVYPNRNTKLLTTNIRTRIQDVIYQSIFAYSACSP